jgi:proteasome activator subunit 4
MVTFLPLSHPQIYLPMIFRLWESINSYRFDNRMLEFLAKLSEIHVAQEISDPRKLDELPDDERSEAEERPAWGKETLKPGQRWLGIYKDVGIFSDHEWDFIMCKCLASMGPHLFSCYRYITHLTSFY